MVQERTAEIRSVVDNQNQVLSRLKSASDSFDELQDEIKQIKQQFIETSMRRSAVLDDLEYERQQWQYDMMQAGAGAAAAAHAPAGRSYRRATPHAPQYEADDDDGGYEASSKFYRTPAYSAPVKPAQLDRDLESDTITSGALQGLAIAPKTSQFALKDDYASLLSESRYGGARQSSYASYASSATSSRRQRSASMYDDLNDDYDVSATSTRSKIGSRFSSNGYAREDDDPPQLYTSPNLPSYRRYEPASYDTDNATSRYRTSASDYTKSSYASRYGADAYDDGASATSSDSGRYGHKALLRSQTVDSYSSYDRSVRDKYSTPTSSFSSKFLDKVRQKKASGEDVSSKTDKPFSSRFLGPKTTFDSPYSSKSYSSASATSARTESSPGAAVTSDAPDTQTGEDN